MKSAIVSGVRIATELHVTVLVPFSGESPTYIYIDWNRVFEPEGDVLFESRVKYISCIVLL